MSSRVGEIEVEYASKYCVDENGYEWRTLRVNIGDLEKFRKEKEVDELRYGPISVRNPFSRDYWEKVGIRMSPGWEIMDRKELSEYIVLVARKKTKDSINEQLEKLVV